MTLKSGPVRPTEYCKVGLHNSKRSKGQLD